MRLFQRQLALHDFIQFTKIEYRSCEDFGSYYHKKVYSRIYPNLECLIQRIAVKRIFGQQKLSLSIDMKPDFQASTVRIDDVVHVDDSTNHTITSASNHQHDSQTEEDNITSELFCILINILHQFEI